MEITSGLIQPVALAAVSLLILVLFLTRNRSTKQPVGYFGRHVERDTYLELSEQYSPEDVNGKRILASALMKRAMEDVRRIMQIKDQKAALGNLVKQGAMSEDTYERFLQAEQDIEIEVQEVLVESEMYKSGWKDTIFKEASAYLQRNEQLKQQQAVTEQIERNSREDMSTEEHEEEEKVLSKEQEATIVSSIEELAMTESEKLVRAEARSLKAMNALLEEEEREESMKLAANGQGKKRSSKESGKKKM